MKKSVFIFLLALLTSGAYAQIGDLFVGAQGGYISQYKDGMYGLNVAYHLADPLELSFTGLLNPFLSRTDELDGNVEKLNFYSLNLDFRYYLFLMRSWASGPVLGYQYGIVKDKNPLGGLDANSHGFNLGWHFRHNITDELKVMGGWRYTMGSEEARHHYFYVGIGYTFSLY